MSLTRSNLYRALRVAAAGSLLLLAGCHHATQVPPLPPQATAPPAALPAPKPAPTPDDLQGPPAITEVGLATWYAAPRPGARAADGSVFDPNALTAAHRTLPMGSIVRITNLATGQSVIARITDRGPFVPGRILDLSPAAAKETGVYRAGLVKVRLEAWPKPGADPIGHWCVQIGAFLTQEDSIQLKNELLQRYPTAKVIQFAGPTGHWVRLTLTKGDRSQAEAIAATIRVPDADPYVVRLN